MTVVGGRFLLVVVHDSVGGGCTVAYKLVVSGHYLFFSLVQVDPCHLAVVIASVCDGRLLSLLLLFQSQVQ